MNQTSKIAVVVFNLGGPDRLESVRPFLFQLFSDPLIIRLPNPFRFFLAHLISKKREKEAKEIYAHIGGKSPILDNTLQQASALEKSLKARGFEKIKVFTSMRYWHPFVQQTVQDVQKFNPDQIVILPLYPQFSTTTSQSFLRVWRKACGFFKLNKPEKIICCYPENDGFIEQGVQNISIFFPEAQKFGKPILLLSAHGLPEKIIKSGDPYQSQCEMTAAKIINLLEKNFNQKIDYEICYQSRVGPMKWIGPSTDELIEKYAKEKRPIVIYPIAFVSEHSETLYEIDQLYRSISLKLGSPFFAYAPAVSVGEKFIEGLSNLIEEKLKSSDHEKYASYPQICAKGLKCCAHQLNNKW